MCENNSIYYNINPLLSHNAMISMVVGERGNGKTYSGKRKMINDFLKKGTKSIYVRRQRDELDMVKTTLFNDIILEFPDIEITTIGNNAYINGELFCYFISLSTSNKIKSASYPDVNFMFFDEYVINPNSTIRYLRDELTIFYDLIESVFRTRLPKVYIASNNVSYCNPLFEDLGINQKVTDKFLKFYGENGDIDICIEFTDCQEYKEMKKSTRWGKYISKRQYGQYAIENNSLYDKKDFIEPKKPIKFNYCYARFLYQDGTEFYLWTTAPFTEEYYFSNKGNKNSIIHNICIDGLLEKTKAIDCINDYKKLRLIKDSLLVYNRVLFSNTHIKNYVMNDLLPKIKRF